MSKPIIIISNLGKKYSISHQAQKQRYVALRDVLSSKIRGVFRNDQSAIASRNSVEDFWALKNVTFEVNEGEVVGIIGRNGAGKSTLLKVLSRITEPTEGEVRIRGRVASLLEVGTGFHPELTGRENVFLNGSILGMSRAEIRKKFDEIVAFADVERFLDIPVKRFSSGMYVRLAFAVAAHLEPEILVVDEVLAVGDAEFQKKCLGKMSEVARSGRTILFVSHNLGTVRNLCGSGVLLQKGLMKLHGDVASVLEAYSGSVQSSRHTSQFAPKPECPSITSVSLVCEELLKGNVVIDIAFESPFTISPVPGVTITSQMGTPIFGSNPRFQPQANQLKNSKSGIVRFRVDGLPIHAGKYQVSVWLGDWHSDYDAQPDAISFDFRPGNSFSNMPNLENIGHLDWSCAWTMIG